MNRYAYKSQQGVRRSDFGKYQKGSSFSYGGNAPQAAVKPHSGCRIYAESTKTKKPVITGWKYTRKTGLFSFVATPWNKDKGRTKNPKFDAWCVKIKYPMMPPVMVTGFWNNERKLMTIPEMNLAIDPMRNFVAFYKPKRR